MCAMSWNYRVVKKVKDGSEFYGIHEVFYDENKNIWTLTEDPVRPFGESLDEIKNSYLMMAESFLQNVINYDDFLENKDKDIDEL